MDFSGRNSNFFQNAPRADFNAQGQPSNQVQMLGEQLQTAIGYYVSCDFLIGTQIIETKDGILAKVGTNFLTLYQPDLERYVVCDLYALKFISIYNTTSVPRP